MTTWTELALDLAALILLAAGVWLIYEPAGLIAAGLGVLGLSVGLRQRRSVAEQAARQAGLKGYEVEERR